MEITKEKQEAERFIKEKKAEIVNMIKAQGLDKEGAKQFLGFLKGMVIDSAAGFTEEMKQNIMNDWPQIEEEILKGF